MGLAKNLESPTLEWLPSVARLPRHAPAAARARGHRRRRLSGDPAPWPGAARSRSTTGCATGARSSTIATTGRCASCARFHPEGGVCHSVLVHPPGGIVGGDELAIELDARRRRARARDDARRDALLSQRRRDRRRRRCASSAARPEPARMAAARDDRLQRLHGEQRAPLRARARRRDDRLGRHRARPAGSRSGPSTPAASPRASSCRADGSSAARSPPATIALLDSPLGWAGRRVLATMWFASRRRARPGAQRRLARRRARGRRAPIRSPRRPARPRRSQA